MKKLLISASIALAIVLGASIAPAAEKKPEPPAAPGAPAKRADRPLPFNGKIDGVDATAKTITVGERTFHVGAETRIMKMGKPATLADAKKGEEIGGSYRTAADGKLNAISLRLGPKPERPAPAPEAK